MTQQNPIVTEENTDSDMDTEKTEEIPTLITKVTT